MTQVIADGESSLAMQVKEETVTPVPGNTVQVSDSTPTAEEDATSALQALQYAGKPQCTISEYVS